MGDPKMNDRMVLRTAQRTPGEPEDIACAVLYLASDASSWVTGKVFEVDGGVEAPSIVVPAPVFEPTPIADDGE